MTTFCSNTGAFDWVSIERVPELQREQERLNASVLSIAASHIVNESTTMVCPVPESSFATRSRLFPKRAILLVEFPAYSSWT